MSSINLIQVVERRHYWLMYGSASNDRQSASVPILNYDDQVNEQDGDQQPHSTTLADNMSQIQNNFRQNRQLHTLDVEVINKEKGFSLPPIECFSRNKSA